MIRVAMMVLGLSVWAGCSGRGLSTEQLSAAVEEQKASLDACYTEALEKRPVKLEREGRAILVIAPSGEVTSVAVDGNMDLPGLEACLREAMLGWEFPEAGAKTRTSLPLLFKPEVVKAAPTPTSP